MPLRLSVLEYVLGKLNLLPMPLFDMPLASGIAKMLVTACELGLFDVLNKRKLSLQALAEEVNCHPQGLQLLLQILVSAGYLHYRHGTYSNTHMARCWLTSQSRRNIVPYILHSQDLISIWDHVSEIVHTNQQVMQVPYAASADSPEMQQWLTRHYAGLVSLATALGGEIVHRVRMPDGVERLLDVGGSHAGYSALFCRKYSPLHATILDIEPGILAGRSTARQMKLEERMSFVCGDIVKDDFPQLFVEPFDVALYFHIAHLFPPELNAVVLEKVARTLRPGGLLVFVDQITDQAHRSHLASLIVQFMALTTATIGGTCYSFSEIKGWLELVGMEQVHSHRLLTPGVYLITAIKSEIPSYAHTPSH